jgi:nucleoside-diphosphate-sugar epimerase
LRVLVIGSSGFIGRALTRHLLAAGHAVEAWSRGSEPPRARCTHRAIDLLEPRTFESARGPWDGAVHLAAHSVPGAAFTSATVLENLAMAAHALDHLARVQPGLRVIFMSSSHVYGTGPSGSSERKREDDALDPVSAYGLSKELCEAWARAKRAALSIVVVRAFHQIGAGMPAGLLIPDLLSALSSGRGTVVMRGPDSVRDFLDVRDGVVALERLLRADVRSGDVFNLCSGEGTSVASLARGLMQRLGIERELHFQSGSPPPLVGDPAKLSRAIDWSPRYALADTLSEIVAGSMSSSSPRPAT